MDNKKLQYFKEKLLKEREKQVKDLESRDIFEDNDFTNNEESSFDNHPADLATDLFMKEQELGFINQIKETINEINSSLRDIENRSYGFCSNCNKYIKEERLELIPYAKTCLECFDEEDLLSENKEDSKNIYESLNHESFNNKKSQANENKEYNEVDNYQDALKDNIVENDPSYSTGDNIDIAYEEDYDEIFDEEDIIEDVEKISEEFYKDSLD